MVHSIGKYHFILGGSLLVLEKLLTSSKTGPRGALLMDLGMMLCCEGKERNADEYRKLLSKEGYTVTETRILAASQFRDIILSTK